MTIKPKAELIEDEELMGSYEDKSRWIDRLFSTAGKKPLVLVQKLISSYLL